MLHVLVNSAGEQQRVIVGDQPDVPDGLTLVTFGGLDSEPSSTTHRWDAGTRSYVLRATVEDARFKMTAGDFMRRLGFEREAYLHAVRLNPETPLALRAQLETLVLWLGRIVLSGVDLRDPLVPIGVAIMAQVLSAGDQLAEGVEAFTANMMAEVIS
jgi:hypothetical protein